MNLINFQEGFFYCDNVLLMMTSDVIPQSRCSKAEYAHTCVDDHLCLLNCHIYIYINKIFIIKKKSFKIAIKRNERRCNVKTT
jgi:hypothetical protein